LIISGKKLKTALRSADITQEKAAELMGVSRQTVNSWVKVAELNKDVLLKVKTFLNLDLEGKTSLYKLSNDTFVDGNENVTNGLTPLDNENQQVTSLKPRLEAELIGIPMYDSAATASGVEVYNDLVQDEPAFVVNIPQFRDCSFGKVIYGHSMYPTIESGTYVFCKPVSNKLHIIPGEIYYIEYDNYGVVKRLQKGDSPENVLAVSDNDEVRKDGSRRYESYTIPFDSIRNIYLIKGHFKQSHN
jgi:transcriptional regulator with XRE-family HTH domain